MHPSVTDLFFKRRLTLIAGPCVAESTELCLSLAKSTLELTEKLNMGFIFKASFDKANRTSIKSYRGPGMADGLAMLKSVKDELGVPVLTDVHLPDQVEKVAALVDVLQIPAFLCRQTDLIMTAAQTGLPVNIKKGQFLAPDDMRHAVTKHRESGIGPVAVTERGSSFGYNNLVVDMRSLVLMREITGASIIFDATHSVQRPGAGDGFTTGDRHLAPALAKASAAIGIDGLFVEVHPDPDHALSDGPNSLTPRLLEDMLIQVAAFDTVRRSFMCSP